MKRTLKKAHRAARVTLGELVSTINQMTHNERLSAAVVADMINSRLVRLEGDFRGHRVRVA